MKFNLPILAFFSALYLSCTHSPHLTSPSSRVVTSDDEIQLTIIQAAAPTNIPAQNGGTGATCYLGASIEPTANPSTPYKLRWAFSDQSSAFINNNEIVISKCQDVVCTSHSLNDGLGSNKTYYYRAQIISETDPSRKIKWSNAVICRTP